MMYVRVMALYCVRMMWQSCGGCEGTASYDVRAWEPCNQLVAAVSDVAVGAAWFGLACKCF